MQNVKGDDSESFWIVMMHFPFLFLVHCIRKGSCSSAAAAAGLVPKESKYKIVQEEGKQKEKTKALDDQRKKDLERQRSELEHLHVGNSSQIGSLQLK